MIASFLDFLGFALITSVTAACFAAKVKLPRERRADRDRKSIDEVSYSVVLFVAFSCPSSDDSLCSLMGGSEPTAFEIFIFLDCYKVASESVRDTMYCTLKTS